MLTRAPLAQAASAHRVALGIPRQMASKGQLVPGVVTRQCKVRCKVEGLVLWAGAGCRKAALTSRALKQRPAKKRIEFISSNPAKALVARSWNCPRQEI